MQNELVNELLTFIQKSPSCFHAVDTMKHMLLENGYQELKECESWKIEKSGNVILPLEMVLVLLLYILVMT